MPALVGCADALDGRSGGSNDGLVGDPLVHLVDIHSHHVGWDLQRGRLHVSIAVPRVEGQVERVALRGRLVDVEGVALLPLARGCCALYCLNE